MPALPHRARSPLALIVILWLLQLPGLAAADPVVHFVGGKLITLNSTGAPDAVPGELLVVGDRISALGRDLQVPAGAEVINLSGGFLTPGLTEMHAHVPAPARGESYRDEVLFLYLANGVTTIRGMLGDPDHLRLREDLTAHRVLGPRLYTSGPSFNGRSVESPAQARAMVQAQVQADYDFLKVHPGLSLAEYDAMAETARDLAIPFAGHVPAEVGLEHALASGQASVDHLDGYLQALVPDLRNDTSGLFAFDLTDQADEARIEAVVAWTLEAGAAVVPTETLLENFGEDPSSVTSRPQNAYLPQALRANYEAALARRGDLAVNTANRFLALRKRILLNLHDSGALLVLGSDAPQIFNVPGFSLHRELQAMVAAGLTPGEALITGTRNAARFFDAEDEFGTLAPGTSADLIWLEENPLEDITHSRSIRGVMVRGRWLDRARLDEGLAAIRTRHEP